LFRPFGDLSQGPEQQGPLVIHSPIGDLKKSPFKLKPIHGVSMSAQPAALAPLGNVLSEELRNFKAFMIGIVKSDGGIEIQGNIPSRKLNIPLDCIEIRCQLIFESNKSINVTLTI
jgi:hypothetical protein